MLDIYILVHYKYYNIIIPLVAHLTTVFNEAKCWQKQSLVTLSLNMVSLYIVMLSKLHKVESRKHLLRAENTKWILDNVGKGTRTDVEDLWTQFYAYIKEQWISKNVEINYRKGELGVKYAKWKENGERTWMVNLQTWEFVSSAETAHCIIKCFT